MKSYIENNRVDYNACNGQKTLERSHDVYEYHKCTAHESQVKITLELKLCAVDDDLIACPESVCDHRGISLLILHLFYRAFVFAVLYNTCDFAGVMLLAQPHGVA